MNKPTKDEVSRQFGRNARAYALSEGHARGSDLGLVVDMLAPQPEWRVLDVATGAGHTAAAVAPHVQSVMAIDLAPEMVFETELLFASRLLENAVATVMDVERLNFESGAFDAVTCRIAPHHFIDVEEALREIARVLPQGGVFVMEDSFAPQARSMDTFINTVEKLRDPTHVRSYTKREWRAMLQAAGFRVVKSMNYRKMHDIEDWMNKAGLPAAQRPAVLDCFRDASPKAQRHFEITFDSGEPVSYVDDKVIFKAL